MGLSCNLPPAEKNQHIMPGGGGTLIFGLYGYMPQNRVRVLRFSVLKKGIVFDPFVTVFLVWSLDRVAKLYYPILE